MSGPDRAEPRTDLDRQRLAGEALRDDVEERTGDARDAVTGEVGSAHLTEPSDLEPPQEPDPDEEG